MLFLFSSYNTRINVFENLFHKRYLLAVINSVNWRSNAWSHKIPHYLWWKSQTLAILPVFPTLQGFHGPRFLSSINLLE